MGQASRLDPFFYPSAGGVGNKHSRLSCKYILCYKPIRTRGGFTTMKLIPAILISLAFGFALGSIPVVNEHLHWNFWFIIPVSGLLFGMAAGFLQFWSCYALNQKVSGANMFILALAGLVGYVFVDYGIFLSTTIHLKDV